MTWMLLTLMITFLIVSLLILIQKHKDWKHPAILFDLLWLAACILLIINPNKYYQVSYKTIWITLLGAICFNIPTYLETIIDKKSKPQQVDIDVVKRSKIRTLFWIQLILTLLMIPLSIRAVSFISIYGFAFMRNVVADGITYGYMSTLERMIYIHYIIFPLIKALSLVQLVMYARGKCKAFELIPTIINQALLVVTTTGRNDLLMFIIWGMFAISVNKKFSSSIRAIIKKQGRTIKFVICIAGVAIIGITFVRHRMSEESLISSYTGVVHTYVAGGFQLLDLALRDPVEWRLNTYTLGVSTFKGLLDTVNTTITMLTGGVLHLPEFYANANIQTIAEEFHAVSATKTMNAYVTMYYYFLRDLGYVGLICFTTMLSMLCSGNYKKMCKNPSLDHQLNYYIMLNIIFFSTIWWEPINSSFWVYLIWTKILVFLVTGKVGKLKIKLSKA